MKDAIAYMAWERVVPWKILSIMAHPDRSLVPLGFGSRDWAFQDQLEPGSRIWVVTRVADEFSLAGRVVVADILERDCIPRDQWPKDLAGLFIKWKFVARADLASSEFFETNNASPAMADHQVRFAQNRTIVYRDGPLDVSFQPCIDQACETVFLSYRWSEARRFAIALARELRRQGLSPWLDALSIPAYEAGRDPGVNSPRLKKLIELGIEKSRMAIVINTGTYAQTLWTRMELGHIRRKGGLWFQVMRGGRELKCSQPPIFDSKPEAVVQEILRQYIRHGSP